MGNRAQIHPRLQQMHCCAMTEAMRVNTFGFERGHRLGRFLNVTPHDQTRTKTTQRTTLPILEQRPRIREGDVSVRQLSAKKIIVNTGTRPACPNI